MKIDSFSKFFRRLAHAQRLCIRKRPASNGQRPPAWIARDVAGDVGSRTKRFKRKGEREN